MTRNSKISVGLSITAVIGVVATAIISANRQEKMRKLKIERCSKIWENMEDEEYDKREDEPFESVLDTKEKTKLIFKAHWPTMIAGSITIGCIAGAQILDIREIMGLTAGLAAITYKYNDLKRYLQEKFPDEFKEAQKYVDKESARRAIEKLPIKEETYDGRKRYYFPLSDQIVYMKPEDLIKVQGFISAQMGTEMQVTLNEILDYIHYELGYKDVHISDKDYIWEFGEDTVETYDFPQIELDYDDVLDDDQQTVMCQVVQLSIMGEPLLERCLATY